MFPRPHYNSNKIDLNCMGTLLIGVNLFSLCTRDMHWGGRKGWGGGEVIS